MATIPMGDERATLERVRAARDPLRHAANRRASGQWFELVLLRETGRAEWARGGKEAD